MSRRAEIHEAAPPRIREYVRAIQRRELIVRRRDDNARKRESHQRHRSPPFGTDRVAFGFRIGRRYQQRAAHAQRGRRGPERHERAPRAMRDEHDIVTGLEHRGLEHADPLLAHGRLPVVLGDTHERRVVVLPERLPVLRARVVEPWQDQGADHRGCKNVRSSRKMNRFDSANAKFASPSGSAFNRARYASYAAIESNEMSAQAMSLVPSWGRK